MFSLHYIILIAYMLHTAYAATAREVTGNRYILITIKVSKMTKVTSQALYKKDIEIKEKKKKINESSDDF